MVRRSAWYTGFGSRDCCTASLHTRLPNASVARGARGSFASVTDQSRIALIASPNTAEPIVAPLLGIGELVNWSVGECGLEPLAHSPTRQFANLTSSRWR